MSDAPRTRKLERKKPTRPFEPDWASPPGETITELMDEKGLSVDVLSTVFAGYCVVLGPKPSDLLSGAVRIDAHIAMKLAALIGGTPLFWLNRDLQYVESCVRLGMEPGAVDSPPRATDPPTSPEAQAILNRDMHVGKKHAMHYAGALSYTKANGSTVDVSGGYAACCSGRATMNLTAEGRTSRDPKAVTCGKCIRLMNRARKLEW